MSAADDDPIIPPEWVRLSELPGWIHRIYNVGSDGIRRELILAVRHRRQIPHRVQCQVNIHRPRGYPSLPPGLELTDGFLGQRRHVFVADWGLAAADWQSCTVGGWTQGDGTRERLPIEVRWESVEDFVAIRLFGWKKQARLAALAETGQPPRQTSSTAYNDCVACLQALARASPDRRTLTRPQLKALCKGKLGEEG